MVIHGYPLQCSVSNNHNNITYKPPVIPMDFLCIFEWNACENFDCSGRKLQEMLLPEIPWLVSKLGKNVHLDR